MNIIETTDAFKALIEDIKSTITGYKDPLAFGICRVDLGQINVNKTLQATYPLINWNENFGSAAVFVRALQEQGIEVDFTQSEVVCNINLDFLSRCLAAFTPYSDEAHGDAHKNIQVISALYTQIVNSGSLEGEFKVTFIYDDSALKSVEATYLKLYALSQAKVHLRELNLDGAFGALPNVAWSNGSPIELEYLREFEIELKLANEYPHIDFVDKFPRFLQHIIPADNTRILDTSKVRFGAQLAAGTTVMPGASYVNFNAGTTGPVMVEGRISSSAIVGAGSDIGGGASIWGVLSGTDGDPITIGKNTLLGTNSTTGMSIGDGCYVEGNTFIHPSMPFFIEQDQLDLINKVNQDTPIVANDKELITISYIDKRGNLTEKVGYRFMGHELLGKNGLQFRDDKLAQVMLAFRSQKEIKLNFDLH